MNNFHEYLKHSLKSGGTKKHFRRVKVPGTTPYWKVWCICKQRRFTPTIVIILLSSNPYLFLQGIPDSGYKTNFTCQHNVNIDTCIYIKYRSLEPVSLTGLNYQFFFIIPQSCTCTNVSTNVHVHCYCGLHTPMSYWISNHWVCFEQ